MLYEVVLSMDSLCDTCLPDHQVHIDKAWENSHNFETTDKAAKLMHRFTEQQLEKVMDEEMMKEPDSYVH